MPYRRCAFRDQKVYAEVREDGSLAADAKGRVTIKYRLEDDRTYSAAANSLKPLPGADVVEASPAGERAAAGAKAAKGGAGKGKGPTRPIHQNRPAGRIPSHAVHIYTDGACTGNPGPMGIGVVLLSGGHRKELSEYLGLGTNNIAELTAIERGLTHIKDRARPTYIYSDSGYSIGVLAGGWKAKANQELIERIRNLVAQFPHLEFVKVRGHSGVAENERCDELARAAIVRGH